MCSKETKAQCEAFLEDTEWRYKDSPIKGPRPKREDSDEENPRKKTVPHCLKYLIPNQEVETLHEEPAEEHQGLTPAISEEVAVEKSSKQGRTALT